MPRSVEEMAQTADASPDSLRDAAPVLRALGIACLVLDERLTVRAAHGALELIDAGPEWLGRRLGDLLPALALEPEVVRGLLEGTLAGAVVECSKEPPLEARLFPARGEDATPAILLTVQSAAGATALRTANERQRRELHELRGRVQQLTLELTMAQADLRRLDDAKAQFVSAAAHELRNPLAALIGYTEILTEEVADRLTADQQQSLSGIAHSALRLRQLTNNLLDLSRLDSDRLELVMQAVDPLDLLDGALAEMQPLMDAKQQQLLIKAEPLLPAIWCDKQRALQILVNLLSNANKYTAAGGRIAAEVHHQRDEPFVTFAIRDEGIGIPADDQPQLFLRFYRAANATAADGAGAGLGLALTQSLVRLHGGRIWFESTQGKGTTFYVTFPVAA